MVPTSALRETIVLIIFGIVLVPIAAKRAQDAPGYWKAFTANTPSLVYQDQLSWTSGLMLMAAGDDTQSPCLPVEPSKVQNKTASVNSVAIKSQPKSKGPITIQLRLSSSEEAAHTTTMEISAQTEAAKVSSRAIPAEEDVPMPPTATTSSAANRERWTLIWMGTAILAVALFMSSC
ncbi:hypothetical protein N8I77_003869 [Diaporthe amygdali]|uniref:Uncharacterized protein n=1 Tax=Phomopsis amygdali TaxID=1214568 RepID=A0AAD9SL44_PHOAM|nr:hypothetical protein N8I77_003869 [Diaporthe amygdali]